jgi:hypothetical protein
METHLKRVPSTYGNVEEPTVTDVRAEIRNLRCCAQDKARNPELYQKHLELQILMHAYVAKLLSQDCKTLSEAFVDYSLSQLIAVFHSLAPGMRAVHSDYIRTFAFGNKAKMEIAHSARVAIHGSVGTSWRQRVHGRFCHHH